jgi:hypothetical protein
MRGFARIAAMRSVLLPRVVHSGSRRVWPAVLTAAALLTAAGTGGCLIIDEDDDWEYVEEDVPPPVEEGPTVLTTIDADVAIAADQGEGVGVFVEYTTGGLWRVWTTCDTNYSGVSCAFDLCVSTIDAGESIARASGDGLEGSDQITAYADGYTCLRADTDADTDAMTFEAEPGSIVRLEVGLDGVADARFVYWMGDGVLHQGAPSNPIDFAPATP